MGSLVAHQLRAEGARFVVVDNDPEKITAIEPEGLLYVKGDASEETTLLEAGLARADTLVATLPRDSDNVYVALTARGLNKELLIIARAYRRGRGPMRLSIGRLPRKINGFFTYLPR